MSWPYPTLCHFLQVFFFIFCMGSVNQSGQSINQSRALLILSFHSILSTIPRASSITHCLILFKRWLCDIFDIHDIFFVRVVIKGDYLLFLPCFSSDAHWIPLSWQKSVWNVSKDVFVGWSFHKPRDLFYHFGLFMVKFWSIVYKYSCFKRQETTSVSRQCPLAASFPPAINFWCGFLVQ